MRISGSGRGSLYALLIRTRSGLVRLHYITVVRALNRERHSGSLPRDRGISLFCTAKKYMENTLYGCYCTANKHMYIM